MPKAFVLGNGTSRSHIDLKTLNKYGTIYACNAVYREYSPDYLIAVDPKMVKEIASTGYQLSNQVWTNTNKNFKDINGLNYFSPRLGWSSGPTALHFASEHKHNTIYILGFDFKGLDKGRYVNNIYADTNNYKKSSDTSIYFGNWLKQTCNVVESNPDIMYVRIIQSDNFCPVELNKFSNFSNMLYDDFIHNTSHL
jgi:hypothetical protein